MPLVRIMTKSSKYNNSRRRIGDAIHQAMIDTIDIPAKDRFQVFEVSPELIYDNSYLDISRSDDLIIIQITLAPGRSLEKKRALYRRIAELVSSAASIRQEDVFINLVETLPENWSFGLGLAQYADRPPPHLRSDNQ